MFDDIKQWLGDRASQAKQGVGDFLERDRGRQRQSQYDVDPSTFDPSNPESVGQVQKMLNVLGYKGADNESLVEDSMFGKNTERAWRSYMNDQRLAHGKDPYQGDKSQYVADQGGMLGKAYFNLDKKLSGWLPGGYKRNPGMEAPVSDRNRDRNPF